MSQTRTKSGRPMLASADSRWLMLIHQIPPKPGYLRVKISRRLHRIGAVAIKNSVYVLPKNDAAQEHFEWILREIVEGGGDGSMCEARFVDGLSDEQIEALFHTARDAEYEELSAELRALEKDLPRRGRPNDERRAELEGDLARLRRRLDEIVEIDFFSSSGREGAQALVRTIERRITNESDPSGQAAWPKADLSAYRGRTWVTRKGIHVDRMASAWLIRRFIDREARLKFVVGKGYVPETGELRFDMFDGEFTHEGDLCTFEVLARRLELTDPAIRPIGEVVHDVDLKDGKFRRAETTGIELVINAIAHAHRDDETRLARASAVLDDLYELYRKKRSG